MKVHTAGPPPDQPAIELDKAYRTRHGATVDLRISSRHRLGLLQTQLTGPVQEDLPAGQSLGADQPHFAVRADRREGRRQAPVSAALFFRLMMRAALAVRIRLRRARRLRRLQAAATASPRGQSSR